MGMSGDFELPIMVAGDTGEVRRLALVGLAGYAGTARSIPRHFTPDELGQS